MVGAGPAGQSPGTQAVVNENTALRVLPQILFARTRQNTWRQVGKTTGETRLVPVTVCLKKMMEKVLVVEASTM